MTPTEQLRNDAIQIWREGVDAVTPARLFRDKVQLDGTRLAVEGGGPEPIEIELAGVRRLVVVGAGKAAAAMAIALRQVVLIPLATTLPAIEIEGWINAPEDTFSLEDVIELGAIHLHAARPPGINSPTEAAMLGTQRILELVGNCDQRDCVICLLSGGGSALLVAPAAGVNLADKQAVARQVAAVGGNIEQLNAVRRPLSQVKGGGLARACRAGRLLTLILSDVLGDALDTIASGPTTVPPPTAKTAASTQENASRALSVLDELGLSGSPSLAGVVGVLQQQTQFPTRSTSRQQHPFTLVENVILGNNADAVDAAGVKAVELGYRYVMQSAQKVEGDVLQVARLAADAIEQLASQDQINCWISGGEPTVTLPPQGSGRGGRNQQLALAVLREMQLRKPQAISSHDMV
ncbi:MAG: DUF4147 domain-containing protein, partial [Planctomycetales bacterium]|nr:DUF4147 domain-containing protein [Planctomycetales bacterium]